MRLIARARNVPVDRRPRVTGPQPPIELAVEVSVMSGVAPLGVVLNAWGTLKHGETNPGRNITYGFDFGDTNITTFLNPADPLSNPNKIVGGPLAGHVYEVPGTYYARVYAWDGTNRVRTGAIRIEVIDPNVQFAGTKTICYSLNTDFTDAPAGAVQVPNATFASMLSDSLSRASASGGDLRFLLNTGPNATPQTWVPAAQGVMNITASNVVYGKFGPGARVLVNCSSVAVNGAFSPGGLNLRNIMLRDMDFTGLDGSRFVLSQASCNTVGFTIYNVDAHDMAGLCNWATGGGEVHTSNVERLTIFKSKARNVKLTGHSGANAVYVVMWRHGLILDNELFDSSLAEHLLRIGFAQDSFIHGNSIQQSAGSKSLVDLRSMSWQHQTGAYQKLAGHVQEGLGSKGNIISNNRFANGVAFTTLYNSGARDGCGLGLADPSALERHVGGSMMEGNLLIGGGQYARRSFTACGFGHTIRNNVAFFPQGDGQHKLVEVSGANNTTNSNDITASNNLLYLTGTNLADNLVYVDTTTQATSAAYNNVGSAINDISPRSIVAAGYLNKSNNIDLAQTNPLFTGTPTDVTTSIRAFVPQAASPLTSGPNAAVLRPETRVDALGFVRSASSVAGPLNAANDQTTTFWSAVGA